MCDEDEILLRYHFGDLEASELEEFERRLRDEPGLAERLEGLRRCLEENGSPCEEPCEELAERTAHSVLAWTDEGGCSGKQRFRLSEAIALGGCALLVGALILPAIYASRVSARRVECSNNLKTVYVGLDKFAEGHDRLYPSIGPYENAGLFTVKLANHRYLDREELQEALLCPSSQLATQVSARQASVVVPTWSQLREAEIGLFERLVRFMSGSYAYNFGHAADVTEACQQPQSTASCRIPLLGDAPKRGCTVSYVSQNHGTCGQNVLFQDGSVRFVSGCWAPEREDHLYLNDAGEVAAGRRPQDAVLAPSEATPTGVRVVRFRLLRFP